MKKQIKMTALVASLSLIIITFMMLTTLVFAWYNGQSYVGKTMSYSRRIYIGASTSDITNYHGRLINGEFVYEEIIPDVGFEENNLVPSSNIYLRTDIDNTYSTSILNISLFLQNVTYDAPLNNFLYFGTTNPVFSKETYKNSSVYNSQTGQYKIASIPIITNQVVQNGELLSIYWYVNIDSDAGLEIANASLNLGKVALAFV